MCGGGGDEAASACKTWFQPGPRPVRDAFNHAGVYSSRVDTKPQCFNEGATTATTSLTIEPPGALRFLPAVALVTAMAYILQSSVPAAIAIISEW